MARPKQLAAFNKQGNALVNDLTHLPEGQWAFSQYDEKGILNKITFPTRNPITPMKGADQYIPEPMENADNTNKLMEIWTNWEIPKNTNWKVSKNKKVELDVNENICKDFAPLKHQGDELKVKKMIADAEMVADTQKNTLPI